MTAVWAALEPSLVVDAWNAVFFTPGSPETAALFRIALGLVLVADLVLTTREAPFTLAADGIFDDATYRAAPAGRRLSLFTRLPATRGALRAVLVAHGLAIAAVLVGFLTPVATVVALVTLTSIHHRDPFVLNSGDVLLRLLLLWSLFAPTAYVWSVDAWLLDRDPDALVELWGLRLVQFQVAIVYLRTAFWKLRGRRWRDGSAVYWVTSIDSMRRHELPTALRRPWFYRAVTWGTVAFELAFPLLVWFTPLRWPLLIMAVLFHLGLEWFVRIRLFQWVMLAGLVAFVP